MNDNSQINPETTTPEYDPEHNDIEAVRRQHAAAALYAGRLETYINQLKADYHDLDAHRRNLESELIRLTGLYEDLLARQSQQEKDMLQLRQGYADLANHSHLQEAYVRRLEIKNQDLEEHLRQYQEA